MKLIDDDDDFDDDDDNDDDDDDDTVIIKKMINTWITVKLVWALDINIIIILHAFVNFMGILCHINWHIENL